MLYYVNCQRFKSEILDEAAVKRALIRISHQIIERNEGVENVCILGIKSRGVPMAETFAKNIKEIENREIKTGKLDITLYRDDLKNNSFEPVINATEIDFDVTGMHVILVDDVLYTGRTARAAMDAVTKLGRPATIQLAVLIDRGHRELPIRADFVGKNVPTAKSELIRVHFKEFDGKQNVELYDK